MVHTAMATQPSSAKQFARSARLIYSKRIALAKKNQGKWVAAYDGKLVGVAPTYEALLRLMSEKGLPPQRTATRFIDSSVEWNYNI